MKVRFKGRIGSGVFVKDVDVDLGEFFIELSDGTKLTLSDLILKVLGKKK